MKKWWQLNIILWKQYLIRHRIWLMLFIGMGIIFAVSGRRQEREFDYSGIKIGVFAEDEKGRELIERLKEEEGVFRFLAFEEKEEMERRIKGGALECGFVMPEHFYENLEKGKMMRQITLYYSPASSAHKISYEVVFGHLLDLLSDQVLTDYMNYSEERDIFTAEETAENLPELLKLSDYYRQNGSTFSFVYERVGGEGPKEAAPLNTVKGCIAVLVFLMSLLGLAGCCETEDGLKGLTVKDRIKIKEMNLNISILGSVLLGGMLLFLSGAGEGIKKEISGLLVYFAVLEIYIRIFKLLVRKAETVYGLIPILILGSFLLCPVFIQIKSYLPIAGFMEKLFPVSYYLNWP